MGNETTDSLRLTLQNKLSFPPSFNPISLFSSLFPLLLSSHFPLFPFFSLIPFSPLLPQNSSLFLNLYQKCNGQNIYHWARMRDSESYYFQLFDKALPGGSSARGRAQLSRVPVGPRRRALSVSSPILFESSSLQKIKNYRKVNVD